MALNPTGWAPILLRAVPTIQTPTIDNGVNRAKVAGRTAISKWQVDQFSSGSLSHSIVPGHPSHEASSPRIRFSLASVIRPRDPPSVPLDCRCVLQDRLDHTASGTYGHLTSACFRHMSAKMRFSTFSHHQKTTRVSSNKGSGLEGKPKLAKVCRWEVNFPTKRLLISRRHH